jgi:phosphohistidine phosphatase
MELFLVQHGVAERVTPDHERPLTGPGEEAVRRMARWAAQAGVKVEQIRHSGMKRTEQTATILAEQLNPAKGVTDAPGLKPDDEVHPMAKELSRERELVSVMLVGHLPFLSRLVGLLLVEDPKRDVVKFQNAGIVCLSQQQEEQQEKWSIRWVMPPDLAAKFEAEQPTK